MALRAAACALVVMALTGCYRYVPTPIGNVNPGESVRLAIADTSIRATDGGPEPELARRLGAGTESVEGRIVAVNDSSLLLAVSATLKRADVRGDPPNRVVWAGEVVLIARTAVAGLDRRTVDRTRSVRAAVVGALATYVAVRIIAHFAGSSGGGSDGGGTVVPP